MQIAQYPLDDDEGLWLQDVLTWRLHVVHSKLSIQAARYIAVVSGIPLAYWRVMAVIGQNGACTHSDIRHRIMMDKGQLSRCLKRMIADGLVVAENDSHDQRRQVLSLSPKGRKVFRKTLPKMRQRQKYLLGQLSNTEQKAIFSALKKLEQAAQTREFA